MLLRPSELSLGEAFVRGDFDVEGDLEGVFPLADVILAGQGRRQRARHGARLLSLPRSRPRGGLPPTARVRGRPHSPARDRHAVAYHYDLSNEF
ncbi:MAG: class I SAM-dependent methyltransferase, partial [Actinomycetota bacterium]|nr:class I SAM-dependent methyltransferase [Actinomycetota bacterium]